jgi:ankyrin repeat protein
MACISGQLPVVELLLKRRADIQSKDYSSKTSLYYAEINEHKEIVELLRKNGAKE